MNAAPEPAEERRDDLGSPSEIDLEVQRFVQDLRLIQDAQPSDSTPRRSHPHERPSR
jgi:hypothetical protein